MFPDDVSSITCNVTSFNTFVHDVMKLLYYEHWTDKWKYFYLYLKSAIKNSNKFWCSLAGNIYKPIDKINNGKVKCLYWPCAFFADFFFEFFSLYQAAWTAFPVIFAYYDHGNWIYFILTGFRGKYTWFFKGFLHSMQWFHKSIIVLLEQLFVRKLKHVWNF